MTQVKLGDKNIPFIYQGNKLLYPNPVKDGLMLYYDMKATSNNSQYKDTLKDISGNNNDATLKNFNFTSESGYSDKGLKFDGVDDHITSVNSIKRNSKDISIELNIGDIDKSKNWQYLVYLRDANLKQMSVLIHGGMLDVHIANDTTTQHTYYSISELNKHITVTLTGGTDMTQNVYVDGNKVNLLSGTINSNISNFLNELNIAKAYNDTNKSSLKSIKIYDRILTDQEVQHNYKLEKERWGL
ncbi:LamG domain-containing protein [Mammaliicoccus sp. F-M27]|uniref:LamG domain-containing protein n=1 Tax=Mammaliicoccus sp. F-M27 TaxID=2898687 RepID=UPI001EFA7907|nr:LamG domain-containing protein [Mammaliicoccus sp. F-M27]